MAMSPTTALLERQIHPSAPQPQTQTQPMLEPLSGDAALPVFDSVGLLQGGREILIRHGSECYRLRHTRNDKLILTK